MIKDVISGKVKVGEVFHFQHSLRPFILVRNMVEDFSFLDLETGIMYSWDELEEYEGLEFYEKDNDDDFKGVKIDGKIEWVGDENE